MTIHSDVLQFLALIVRPTETTKPFMSSLNCNSRILNVTRGNTMKLNQALHAIAEGVADWVEKNISVRDLTLAEVIARRNAVPRELDGLAAAELPGLVFEPPVRQRGLDLVRSQGALVREARQFFIEATAGL